MHITSGASVKEKINPSKVLYSGWACRIDGSMMKAINSGASGSILRVREGRHKLSFTATTRFSHGLGKASPCSNRQNVPTLAEAGAPGCGHGQRQLRIPSNCSPHNRTGYLSTPWKQQHEAIQINCKYRGAEFQALRRACKYNSILHINSVQLSWNTQHKASENQPCKNCWSACNWQ